MGEVKARGKPCGAQGGGAKLPSLTRPTPAAHRAPQGQGGAPTQGVPEAARDLTEPLGLVAETGTRERGKHDTPMPGGGHRGPGEAKQKQSVG